MSRPRPRTEAQSPVYPPQMFSYQYNQQWFSQQQAMMHQQIMHHQHG
jgi:hypothetical protein